MLWQPSIRSSDANRSAQESDSSRLVELTGVSLATRERSILEKVDITVYRGEIVTLIGPNGAGKSTLLKVVTGLLKPDAGRVWRRPGLKIGYVPQHLEIDPVKEQYEDAAALYESAIAAKRLAFPDGHWHIGAFLNGLGQCYTTMKSYPEAEAALLEAHAILDEAFGPASVRMVAVINAQVALYDAWDKPSKVAEYQALLPDKN